MYRLQTSVPDDMGAAIEHIRATTGMTVSNIVRAALAEYVREHAPKKDGAKPDKPKRDPSTFVRVNEQGVKEFSNPVKNEATGVTSEVWTTWDEVPSFQRAWFIKHGLQP